MFWFCKLVDGFLILNIMQNQNTQVQQHPGGFVAHWSQTITHFGDYAFRELPQFFNEHLIMVLDHELFEEKEYREKYSFYMAVLNEMGHVMNQYSTQEIDESIQQLLKKPKTKQKPESQFLNYYVVKYLDGKPPVKREVKSIHLKKIFHELEEEGKEVLYVFIPTRTEKPYLYYDNTAVRNFMLGNMDELDFLEEVACDGLHRNREEIKIGKETIDPNSLWKERENYYIEVSGLGCVDKELFWEYFDEA
jgi:hypothetical protein